MSAEPLWGSPSPSLPPNHDSSSNNNGHAASADWNDARSDTADSLEAEYGLEPHVHVPDPDSNDNNNNKGLAKTGTNRQIGGAAVVAGVAGTLLLGPAVGVLAAAGAAGGAAFGRRGAGNVARASGEVVASAGDRLHHFDKKHGVSRKAGRSFVKGANWVSHKLQVKSKTPPQEQGQARPPSSSIPAADALTN